MEYQNKYDQYPVEVRLSDAGILTYSEFYRKEYGFSVMLERTAVMSLSKLSLIFGANVKFYEVLDWDVAKTRRAG